MLTLYACANEMIKNEKNPEEMNKNEKKKKFIDPVSHVAYPFVSL